MFDLIVAGGTVVDGSGNLGYRAHVGVTGETIAAIGGLTRSEARLAGRSTASPFLPRWSTACSLSGHGFAFATVMGNVLADRVESEPG